MDMKSFDWQGCFDLLAKNKDAFLAISIILAILGRFLFGPIKQVWQWIRKLIRSPAPMPKAEAPEATKTDNSQTQNVANQSGGNSAGRDVNIIHNHTNGEDQERYRQSVERQINDLTNRLERANQDKGALDADKQRLQNEINDLRAKLFDIEASFDAAKERADNLAAQLTALSNQVDSEQLAQARGLLAEFDFDGAEKILTQIVNDQELNVRQSAAASYGLGEIAEEQVNWQDALEHYKRAYDLDATLEHQKAYARLCWRMGRWEEAVQLHKDILKQTEAEYGIEHSEYASALNNLATAHAEAGLPTKAEPLYDQALSISRRVLGANHPDTATYQNNLAAAFRDQERNNAAEPLYIQSLSTNRRMLGADHPTTATSLNNLAQLYRAQGRYDDAEPLYDQALSIRRRVLSADHPDIAQTLNNLANLYRAKERYEDAEPLFEEALSIHRRVLGADHPDTATSLNNLALMRGIQGRYAEAAPLFKEAVEIMERVLGAEHPNTKIMRKNYEVLLAEMKEKGPE